MPPCLDQVREVRLYGRRVGEARRLAMHELSFRYDPEYASIAGAPPLSACLPTTMHGASTRRATAWFNGLLPEGHRRERLARIIGTTEIDMWSLLDGAGAECAGAVQFVNPAYEDNPGLYPLSAEELAELLLKAPVDPIGTINRSARISLAGAQDKVALTRDDQGAWHVPLAGAPSTHILKPQSKRFGGLVENEHWTMQIARHAGIDAAATEIGDVQGVSVLVVERYDRRRTPDGLPGRIHQEDTAQALGVRQKYEEEGGPTLADIASVKGMDSEALLDRSLFNWMVGNADGHAKNFSMLEPGTDAARLAPAYDVLCSESYPEVPRDLAIRIGDAKQPGEVTAANVARAAQTLRIDPEVAMDRLSTLGARVAHAANTQVLEPYGLRVTVRDLVRSRSERASRKLAQRSREGRRGKRPSDWGR